MDNRVNRILELLNEHQRIEVSQLSKLMGVSQVTIRKDLSDLEHRGLITREHGYALMKSHDKVEGRLARHYEQKLRIAKRAVRCVPDGSTVMVESGSCCALLAAELAATKTDLTIVTNSAFVANYIGEDNDCQVILIGGIYQRNAQVMVGPMIPLCLTGLYVDLLFIGSDGYGKNIGFTNRDQMRAQAVRDMADHAQRIVVLTESEKFFHRGTVALNLPSKDMMAITDDGVPEDVVEQLTQDGIDLEMIR